MRVAREIFEEQVSIEETSDGMISLQVMSYQPPRIGLSNLYSRPAADFGTG